MLRHSEISFVISTVLNFFSILVWDYDLVGIIPCERFFWLWSSHLNFKMIVLSLGRNQFRSFDLIHIISFVFCYFFGLLINLPEPIIVHSIITIAKFFLVLGFNFFVNFIEATNKVEAEQLLFLTTLARDILWNFLQMDWRLVFLFEGKIVNLAIYSRKCCWRLFEGELRVFNFWSLWNQ